MPLFNEHVKKRLLDAFPVLNKLRSRRAQVYCVGTAKSGTHSVAALLYGQLRSAHEADSERTIELILESASRRQDSDALDHHLLEQDRRRMLEVNSSQLNYFLLENILRLFPASRFILTIRDPYSWLDSFINHQLARSASDNWLKLRDFRFQPQRFTHPLEEKILENKGLYSLDGYLSYWKTHNNRVLSAVPSERLLVVRTDQISQRAAEIAAFCGVAQSAGLLGESHAFKAKEKFDLLNEVEPAYLERVVTYHCGDLMARFFPEMQTAQPRVSRNSRHWCTP